MIDLPRPFPQVFEFTGGAFAIYRDAPSLDGRRTAAIGQLRIDDAEAGGKALSEVCRVLADEGFGAVIGPMDGDTWHAYRHVIESDGARPFMLEPQFLPRQAEAFEIAGFETVATYCSARAAVVPGEELPADANVTIHAWDGGDVNRFLEDVHALCTEAFSRNPFYKPLDKAGFDALYKPLIPRLDKDLVLFARDPDDRLLGFVFGYPDVFDPKAAILKTYASRARGVGRRLVSAFNDTVYLKGFETVIHALMHESNESTDRSARSGGEVFRRYALLGRTL